MNNLITQRSVVQIHPPRNQKVLLQTNGLGAMAPKPLRFGLELSWQHNQGLPPS